MKELCKMILPEYFEDVKSGIKTFEVRKDEDDIQVGDILILEEWKPDGVLTGGYTGRCIRKTVKYVLRDIPQYGLQEGYCIIGLEEHNDGWIPCSERLPNKEEYLKNDGRFIVTDGNRVYQSIYDIYTHHYFRTLKFYNFVAGEKSRYEIDNCVIAWMPLPEPYKEGSE